jgi:hypothetical protein
MKRMSKQRLAHEFWADFVGVIKDVERLKALFALFFVAEDGLCRIGSGRDEEPGLGF